MTDDHTSVPPSSEDVALALRHCWQPVARLEDLRGVPQRAVLLDQPLAVFLTESGAVSVVADRCAHRGAQLSMGKVCGESIQCPYHGWEWAGDGSCVRIPSLADQRQIPPLARIPSYPVRLQWGLVWTTLEEPLTDVPDVPWFDEDSWTWGHGEPFELPVACGLMIENFRDVAHFAFVHEATLGPQPAVVEPLAPAKNGLEVTLRRERSATTRSRPTSPPGGSSPTKANAACFTSPAPSAQPSRCTTGSREGSRASTRRASRRRSPTTRRSTPRTWLWSRKFSRPNCPSTRTPRSTPLPIGTRSPTERRSRTSSTRRLPRAALFAVLRDELRLYLGYQLRLAVGEHVDRPGAERVVIVRAVGDFSQNRVLRLGFEGIGEDTAGDAVRFFDRVDDHLTAGVPGQQVGPDVGVDSIFFELCKQLFGGLVRRVVR